MLLVCASAAAPQFTSYRRDPAIVLEGHWQSCPEADGTYAERVYDHVVNGVGQFEVHMGPGASSRSSRACRMNIAITSRRRTCSNPFASPSKTGARSSIGKFRP